MNRDRIEELLLAIVGVFMLVYILPFSLSRNLAVSVLLAIALILVLVLRSISWHLEQVTPFDGVLIFGIFLSVAYMVSFLAFQQSALTAMALALFAIFYWMMAFLLFQHRWLFRPALSSHDLHAPHYDITQDPAFRKGINPLPEKAPKHHVHDYAHDFSFKKGIAPLPERAPKWEKHSLLGMFRKVQPIPEMKSAEPGRIHRKEFKRGIEPIHEITAEHLHKLGVYDVEKIVKTSKKKF